MHEYASVGVLELEEYKVVSDLEAKHAELVDRRVFELSKAFDADGLPR